MTKVKLKNEVFFFTGVCVSLRVATHMRSGKWFQGICYFSFCLENLLFSSPIHFSRELTFIWKGLLSYRYVWENYNKFSVSKFHSEHYYQFDFWAHNVLKVTTPLIHYLKKKSPYCPNCKTFNLTIFFQALNELFYHFFFLF